MPVRPTRRDLLSAALAAGARPCCRGRRSRPTALQFGPAVPFSFDMLQDIAAAPGAVALRDRRLGRGRRRCSRAIDYDPHNQITYRPDRMLWGDDAGRGEGPLLPPRPLLQGAGADQRRRERPGAGAPVLDRPLRHARPTIRRASSRRRASPASAVMDPEEKNDWLAVLGASYFRTSGYSGQFGMSARGLAINFGRAGAGGVPALQPLLARAGAGGRHRHLRAARGPAGHRRLPDGDRAQRRGLPGHRRDALPARRHRAARHRAADLDVLVRQEQPLPRRPTGGRRSTTATGWRCSSARASGSGGRSTTRRG